MTSISISPFCFQAIGAKFQYMSWPQFVEMVINNELPRHPELGDKLLGYIMITLTMFLV